MKRGLILAFVLGCAACSTGSYEYTDIWCGHWDDQCKLNRVNHLQAKNDPPLPPITMEQFKGHDESHSAFSSSSGPVETGSRWRPPSCTGICGFRRYQAARALDRAFNTNAGQLGWFGE
jgi:hypothetical protein